MQDDVVAVSNLCLIVGLRKFNHENSVFGGCFSRYRRRFELESFPDIKRYIADLLSIRKVNGSLSFLNSDVLWLSSRHVVLHANCALLAIVASHAYYYFLLVLTYVKSEICELYYACRDTLSLR